MGKQPEKLNIASYFVNSIDISINLDWFNEFRVYNYPHSPIDFPLVDLSKILNEDILFNHFETIKDYKKYLASVLNVFDGNLIKYSSLIFLISKALSNEMKKLESEMDYELRKKYHAIGENTYSNEIYDRAINSWLDHSNKQAILAVKACGFLHDDDAVILTKGDLIGIHGHTNAMKIIRIGDLA